MKTIVLVLGGSTAPVDVAGLCRHIRRLLEESSEVEAVVCDVAAITHPDVATIDALARLQLTANRLGHVVRLRHASGELQDLLDLTGLSEVLPLCAGLRLELRGQVEEREPPVGVEEGVEADDPPS